MGKQNDAGTEKKQYNIYCDVTRQREEDERLFS